MQYIILCYCGGRFTSGPYIHNRDHKTSSIITTMNNYYNCYCYYCYCFCCCCRWWYLLLGLLVLWPYSITKSGKCDYKMRQVTLQSATVLLQSGIGYKVRQNKGTFSFVAWLNQEVDFTQYCLRTSLPATRHPPPATRYPWKGPSVL